MDTTSKVLVFILLSVCSNCLPENEQDVGRFDERIEINRQVEMREVVRRQGGRRFNLEQADTDAKIPQISQSLNPVLVWLKKFTDTGKMTNCGPTKMDISWEPKVISASGSVTVSMDAVAATDLTTANIEATVSWGVIKKKITRTVSCQDLKQSYPKLKCPIKKGDAFNDSTTITDLSQLGRISGTIGLDILVKNENGEQFACLKGKIEIQN